MFCSKCGAKLTEGNKFCTRCGTALIPSVPKDPEPPMPAPPKKSRWKHPVLMIVLIIALVICIICAAALAILLAGNGKENTEALWQEQYDLGNRYLSNGNYEEAIVAFCAAIDIDPKRPEAYRGAANAYIAMGDYESAADILDRGAEETGDEDMKAESEQLKEAIPAVPEENTQSAEKQLTAIMRYDSSGDPETEYRFSYNAQGYISEIRYVHHDNEDSEMVYNLTYDDEGRLLLHSTGDPGDISRYGYDEYTYNDAGQLIKFASKEGSAYEEIFEYDEHGLPVRSVVNYGFYESITEYTHNGQGLLTHKLITHHIPDGPWSEEYYYEYNEQGRVAKETYQQAPYERISLYSYGYKDFVLIQPDDGYDQLVMGDIMGHEIFSLAVQNPRFTADASGYLTEVIDLDYAGEQVTYKFLYEDGASAPEFVGNESNLYTEFLLGGGYDEIISYVDDPEALQVRSCLVDFDEDGIEELLISLSLYANEYHTALLDIRDGSVYIAAAAYETGGTMGGSFLCFKYEQKTQSYALVEDSHWRDGIFAGSSGLTVYAKHTYEVETDISRNYYTLQEDPYGNIYAEMAAEVKKETSYYTQDGTDFYFYTINDTYVSEEAYHAATYGYTDTEDPAYQLQDASYYAPVAN